MITEAVSPTRRMMLVARPYKRHRIVYSLILFLATLLLLSEWSISREPQPQTELFDNLLSLRGGQAPPRYRRRFAPCASAAGLNPHRLIVEDDGSSEVSFFVLGDYGIDPVKDPSYGISADWGVRNISLMAEAMNKQSTIYKPKFVLNLGDNFYQDGVDDVNSSRWRSTFEERFNSDHLRGVYWYSMLGNHDYRSFDKGVKSQVQRTFYKYNENYRWCLPGKNYTIRADFRGLDVTMDIVVFDSQSIYGIDPSPINGKLTYQDPKDILKFIEDALCASNADIKLTASHHFLVSTGNYIRFAYTRPEMRDDLSSILARCKATFHFHGHDHLNQVIRVADSFTQIGVGSAGKLNLASLNTQQDLDAIYPRYDFKLQHSSDICAFVVVSVDRNKLVSLRYINMYGEIIYEIQQDVVS